MKSGFPHRIALVLLIGVMTLHSCIQDFTNLADTLSEDITFEIATDLLHNAAAVQIYDQDSGNPPGNIEVEVLNSEFSEVYTYSGKMELNPQAGTLLLGIRKSEIPAPGEMKSLNLRITAPGYYPSTQNLLLDTATQNVVVPLQSMANSPNTAMRQTFFNTNTPGAKELFVGNDAKVTFEQNTTFIDANGLEQSGSIRADLSFYNGADENKRMFADLLSNASYLDPQGVKTDFMINPAAFFEIELSAGNTPIVDLGYPAILEMEIDPNLYNPLERRTIRSGDVIPAFFWNESEEAWETDGFAIAEIKNGRIQANLSVRHFTRWMIGFANVSTMAGMDEECHVFIRMVGNTPDTVRGSYMSGNQTITYEYTVRPEYRFYQIFPGCMSGTNFDLSALIRTIRNRATNYFRNIDPNAFASLTFEPDVNVSVQESPDMCAFSDSEFLVVDVLAKNPGEAILLYEFGHTAGSRQVNLRNGTSSVMIPIPAGSLDPWVYSQGRFTLAYMNGCDYRTVSRTVGICDVPFGIKLGVDNPANGESSVVDISIAAACQSGETDFVIRPTAPVFYRRSCDDNMPYTILGTIRDGELQGELPIAIGGTYDFKVQYGEVVQEYQNVTIPNGSAIYEFEEYTVTIELNEEGVVVFDFGDFILPEGICNLIG